jgi:hypothetical protein
MILLHLTSPTKPAAAPPPLRKGVVVQQTFAAPAEPLRYLRYSGAAVRNNGDSLSRRLLHENGRPSRLKIQAGCRPIRLWGANSWADAETTYPDYKTAIVAAIDVARTMKDRGK